MKKKIMLVFGTRPEAIKMCPLVRELKKRKEAEISVCVTGQHRQMLYRVLDAFSVAADYDLSIMREGQTLFDVTAGVLDGISRVLDVESPDTVLVHGDTSTAFATALACFYKRRAIGHVEAGLRTYDIQSPFPEEFNRRAISLVAEYSFAPTERARQNLLSEGCAPKSIFLTGNTVIDALGFTVREDYAHSALEWASNCRLILLTAHRRESLGEPMRCIFRAVRRILCDYRDVKVIYPVHMNPLVRKIAYEELSLCERIKLIEPLDVLDFHNFLARCCAVLTDSGGIQEEAAFLGIPALVARDTTERPEGVEQGALRLVGTEEENIYGALKLLLDEPCAYGATARSREIFGDGFASRRIADILLKN